MNAKKAWLVVWLLGSVALPACKNSQKSLIIITSKDSSMLENLAAKEVRRYLYLRTGALVPIEQKSNPAEVRPPAVIILAKERFRRADFTDQDLGQQVEALGEQEYLLKTFPLGKKNIVFIAGGDEVATLYGAYRLAEKIGVRFFLHGDVVPDQKIPLEVPVVEERGKPLFRVRGIHPFHDFPEGPDWWNADDYKSVLAQLPKLRMNFFGLHTYPEGHPNAEPTVWIGLAEDSEKDGTVKFSYPSSYQNTLRGNWGYEPARTGDYHFGAAELFERDDYGPEVMAGMIPEPKTLEDSNAVFNRTGALLRDAFSFGRALGIQTCVGTEAPLTVPKAVKQRLQKMGKNPQDPGTIKELYEGIFTRIVNTYPLDTYWIWTDENWTWSDASEAQVKSVVDDLKIALEAAADVRAPFRLATCGWVLGPPGDRTLFDRVLPRHITVSCINRDVGKAPVDPMFARLEGRSRWAIPWLEDDPALTSPQLWVGRMRRDAFDAQAYGCDGLLGIHWRTRVLGPNILSLAWAAWDQTSFAPSSPPLAEIEGPVGGVFVSFAPSLITGTKAEAVYHDVRDRVYGYHIPVPNGIYEVTLNFCEGELKEKGRRVFDVAIQGKKVLEKLDIFARAGALRPLDFRFSRIVVSNGRLDIDFADRIHYPSIAGMIIRGKAFSKKINCGGGAVGDYEADWPETPRYLNPLDFYEDWAASEFGKEAAAEIASVFARLDGRLPQPCIWTGPGGIKPDPRPWQEAQEDYQFVEDLANLRPTIKGLGNQERFDYWLRTFAYMREITHLECLWAEYEKALAEVKKEDNEKARASLAAQALLPGRGEMIDVLKRIFGHLLATVGSPGEMGTVMNWEQHLLPALMHRPKEELEKILGHELPPDAQLPRNYEGSPRVVVPTVRTLLEPDEVLDLKVIILSRNRPEKAALYWREMGKGDYTEVALQHAARGVYRATCPKTEGDLEYYVKVHVDKTDVYFPPTAPLSNQTVVRRP